jgi:hypothetical protein
MYSPILSNSPQPRRLLAPLLTFVGYVSLVAAWIFGNPPYSAPDEWSHYLRAVSLGHGQLVGATAGLEGARVIVGATRPAFLTQRMYEDELEWVAQNTRRVRIPAGLTPGWFRCPLHDPNLSARCLNESPPLEEARDWFNPTATYQPFPYLVPAALAQINLHPDNLTRVMRAGKAVITLVLVGVSVFMLWNPAAGLVSLTGIVVAITPMAVFLSSTLNPSGLEIMSALAFASALLRLTREDEGTRAAWGIVGASGAVLALSRTQAPLWIALHVCLIVPISSTRSFLRMTLQHKRRSAPALTAIFAAILLNRTWDYLYGPTLTFDLSPLRSSLFAGGVQLLFGLREQIGVFNYLEFHLPMAAYLLWLALAAALGVAALFVGNKRERLLLLVSLGIAFALPVLLFAATMRHTGFSLQGRYVLAFSLVVPLMAGEILVRRCERLRTIRTGQCLVAIAAGAGLVQFVAWWTNARRFATGLDGPHWFLSSAEWTPPLGWWPWLILAAGGAYLLPVAAIVDLHQFRRKNHTSHRNRAKPRAAELW